MKIKKFHERVEFLRHHISGMYGNAETLRNLSATYPDASTIHNVLDSASGALLLMMVKAVQLQVTYGKPRGFWNTWFGRVNDPGAAYRDIELLSDELLDAGEQLLTCSYLLALRRSSKTG